MNATTASRTATILPFRVPPGAMRMPACGDGFTLVDRLALQSWGRRAAATSYGRVHIEPPRPGAGPDSAAFALIYRRDDPWSRFGLSRGPAGITVWDSLTGQDLGDYPTMEAALAAL